MSVPTWVEPFAKEAQKTAEKLWFDELGVREIPSSERYLVAAAVVTIMTKNSPGLNEKKILEFVVKRIGDASLAKVVRDPMVRDAYRGVISGIRDAYRNGDQAGVQRILTFTVVRPADWSLGYESETVLAAKSDVVAGCIRSIGFRADLTASLMGQITEAN